METLQEKWIKLRAAFDDLEDGLLDVDQSLLPEDLMKLWLDIHQRAVTMSAVAQDIGEAALVRSLDIQQKLDKAQK